MTVKKGGLAWAGWERQRRELGRRALGSRDKDREWWAVGGGVSPQTFRVEHGPTLGFLRCMGPPPH